MAPTRLKAPKFGKPKSFKKLSGLGKKQGVEPLPDLDDGPERVLNLVDDELTRLTDALGDEQLAKKVLKLKEKHPTGTMLELTVMEYLDRKRIRYVFQQWLLGGRILKGGQVTDYIVDAGPTVMVWECQGQYWHSRPGSVANDSAQEMALLGITFQGKKISKVIEIWESRIMQPNKAMREQTLNQARNGVELGK